MECSIPSSNERSHISFTKTTRTCVSVSEGKIVVLGKHLNLVTSCHNGSLSLHTAGVKVPLTVDGARVDVRGHDE